MDELRFTVELVVDIKEHDSTSFYVNNLCVNKKTPTLRKSWIICLSEIGRLLYCGSRNISILYKSLYYGAII